MRRIFGVVCLGLLSAAGHFSTAEAGDLFGEWARGDGAAQVRIEPCGASICAINTWIRDPAGQREHVGDRLIFDIAQKQDTWIGTAYDPQRKLKMTAEIKSSGGDRLESKGCVLGGLVCRTSSWKRQ